MNNYRSSNGMSGDVLRSRQRPLAKAESRAIGLIRLDPLDTRFAVKKPVV